MLCEPSVFLDLETTGTNPVRDRITEIAVIETRDGEPVSEWSSLIDPERPIPRRIQALTGISDNMVARQPRFAELAEGLLEALDGRLLVAHNARFDYGFLRNEFRRAGLSYRARVLCTVKLSRALNPEHRHHNLDRLIQRHGLPCGERHRALGDTRAVHALVQHLYQAHPTQRVDSEVARLVKRATLPPGLDEAELDALPDTPGVYLFYDSTGGLLYVGKSVNLRSRVLSHFSGDHRSRTDARLSQQVRRVEFRETAGELGALLLEARLIKQHQPVFNHRLRRQNELCAIRWDPEEQAVTPPRIVPAGELPPREMGELFGVFRSRRQAREVLRNLAGEHRLCLQRLGLESGRGPCFGYQLGRCRGVCAGQEAEARHHLRLLQALSALRLAGWPYGGPIGIREHCPDNGRSEVHLVDHWCHLGTATDATEWAELLAAPHALGFDLDSYRLLRRYLERHPKTEVIRVA